MRSDVVRPYKSSVGRGGALLLFAFLLLSCSKLLGLKGGTVQAACTTDAQCAPGYGCLQQLGCRNRCTADSDCGAGSRCFKAFVTTACIPVTEGCGSANLDSGASDSCPQGTRCDGSVCRTQCDSADQCAGGQVCLSSACVSTDPNHESGSGGAGMSGDGAAGASDMGGAGSGGAAPADLCKGVTCKTPPDSACNSESEFKSYDKMGSCADGVCGYVSHKTACTCQNGACTTDPCIAVTCASPPAASCTGADGNTQTTYAASGTCSAGSCSYAPTNKTCAFGCASGACKPDPCAGVTCTTPPGNGCNSGSEFQSYDKTGSCSEGVCSYVSHKTACTCQNGACTTDPCIAVTCASPPAASCTGADGNTQTTYATTGTCSAGSCSYAPTNKTCAFGCANGACKPDPCTGVTCTTPPAAVCKTAATKTTYSATGTCSAGTCSYTAVDAGCGSNKACGGAGVCSVCKTDSSCGATCTACGAGTLKCKDLGTTSQCVACLSDTDCSGATPSCNTTTNTCAATTPSCTGLASTCGPRGDANCCASSVVTGTTAATNPPFYRSYDGLTYTDKSFPATVSDFRLDTYEITVGRFKKFWNGYPGDMPAAGSGKNPNNPSDPGWDATWNTSFLPASQAELTTNVECFAMYQTWTVGNDALPMNCLDWFEAEAFCIWDGGRLPTEAEWNYAAAGGTQQRAYPWGSATPDCTYANSPGCVGGANRVGSESPKGDGLYGQADLAGNVWEWVQDWYATPYANPCTNCALTTGSSNRVFRGGSLGGSSSIVLSSYRYDAGPAGHGFGGGGRCARPR